MSDGLVIDGAAISSEEPVRPAVCWRTAAVVRSLPGVNLPLIGAVILHLAFLVVALLAPRGVEERDSLPKVYPVQLYTVAEAAAVSEPVLAPKPSHVPVVVARQVASSPAPRILEMTPALAATPVPEAVAPVSLAPMAAVVLAPISPTNQVAGAGALVLSADAVPARQGVVVAKDVATTAQGGRAAVVAPVAEPDVAPVVMAHPLYRENPPPEYPPLARRRQWEGTVVLEVLVSAEGRASNLAVHESSGHALLDEAALKAVKAWRFAPGRRGTAAVAMPVLAPVRFGLR